MRISPVFVVLVAFLASATSHAQKTSLDSQAIREAFVGNTAIFTDPELSRLEVYFMPNGHLRGWYGDSEISGSWTIKHGQLCLNAPGKLDGVCSTIVRRDDEMLQLFTDAGEPGGYVLIKPGNPHGFGRKKANGDPVRSAE